MMVETDAVAADAAAAPPGRWGRFQPWLGTAVRLGLAAVWLLAGASKVGDLAASGRAVHAYELLPYDAAMIVGAALPFVELTLGVLLVVGLATRVVAGASAVLLAIFMAGISWAWARGLNIDCGCFSAGGELPAGQDPGYAWELLRDVGFLVLAGFLMIWPSSHGSLDRWLAGRDRTEDEDE
jgi:uncharacterized membrane protein YphA (DoxX/SURF4 family)